MTDRDRTGKVQTVLGTIDPGELGVTLAHEHLLVDLSPLRKPPKEASARRIYNSTVSLETLGHIRHYGALVAENDRLDDIETAIEEVNLFKQHGGSSIVEATNIGLARDPVGLARIAHASGLNIIMGASYYVDALHPPDMDSRTEDDIVAEIVSDITEGVGDSDIRSGIIGEVGCSWPLTDNERKVLRASGRAQALTGAPILIHPGRNELAPEECLQILGDVGADLGKTVMAHMDRTVADRNTIQRIAETGCYLEWDLFGREESYYALNPTFDLPSDAKRMDDIAWMISRGYGHRVVISHDIYARARLLKYGGHGYFYILANIVPRMRYRGFDEASIHRILVDNPATVLTFEAPKRA